MARIIVISARSDADEAATGRDIQAGRSAPMRTSEHRSEGLLATLCAALLRSIAGAIAWRKGRGDRRLLENLDDRQLRDIGISRTLVERDRGPSFWRFR